MSMGKKIDGFDKVMKNLNKEIRRIKGATMKGLIRGAIIIVRDMEKVHPKVPVDEGNLRASRFITSVYGKTQTQSKGDFVGEDSDRLAAEHGSVISAVNTMQELYKIPLVTIGFSAFYAWYVHENIDAEFKRPNSGAKFLEASFKRNKGAVLGVIFLEAKGK